MSNSLERVHAAPEQRIWLPSGTVPISVARAQRTVERYDERLTLARHELTGDWVVFLKKGPFGEPFPVLGLGRELPPSEEIERRLMQADTARHGDRLLHDMERHNEALKEPARRAADEATGIAAEGIEWAKRKLGQHPTTRIFVPRSV